jgi:hypothetical protein
MGLRSSCRANEHRQSARTLGTFHRRALLNSAPATQQQATDAIAAAHDYINHIARAVDASPKTAV